MAMPMRSEQDWANIGAAAKLHAEQRCGCTPSTRVQVNGAEVDLSAALSQFRNDGFPNHMPRDVRELIESLQSAGVFGAPQRDGRNWEGIRAAVEFHAEHRRGCKPSKKVQVDGGDVNLSQALSDFRRHGYPVGIPADLRDLIESYQREGVFGRQGRGTQDWGSVRDALNLHAERRRGLAPSRKVSVNGGEINLSQVLAEHRRGSLPKSCPSEIRKLIETYVEEGVLGYGRSAARKPPPSPNNSSSDWQITTEEVERFLAESSPIPFATGIPVAPGDASTNMVSPPAFHEGGGPGQSRQAAPGPVGVPNPFMTAQAAASGLPWAPLHATAPATSDQPLRPSPYGNVGGWGDTIHGYHVGSQPGGPSGRR
ncbi:hypothetical protein ABT336_19835 [Micromonospora sp. NPDC000207]|uniref:hypothetical protein n=1 Tax=Micromonospora sp. NPDC000207 TaxID=3154246 RepID=UPI00331A70E8